MQEMSRREFLNLAAGCAAAGGLPLMKEGGAGLKVAIVRDPADPIAAQAPARWAAERLQESLTARNVPVRMLENVGQAARGEVCILAAGRSTAVARSVLNRPGLSMPDSPESLAIARGKAGDRPILLACGSDVRGLVCALLELADRVVCADAPSSALNARRPFVERPANPIRSVARLFVSEVEDKPWFYDRSFWGRYLSMLAAQRFNRFSLTFGIGYDFLNEVRDSYLHFAYPFLVTVPGYDVRASGLPDAERERNLETLRFIGEAATARGLHFQIGLWTHGYDWSRNPDVNYIIEGLTPETHAAYCRDALRTLLQACPAIRGVTFRIHGESGIPEATYAFWKTVFDGVAQCGRQVEIDMHAKGIDSQMIDTALATGMPVNVSPKYWAEHMGLPYHQTAIRALEMPLRDHADQGFFAKSGGSRSFLRYGYGDLLAEDRRYGVLHRMWPGTQRLLLWGDPAMAAAYGRASSFCGSLGMELCEPLSFKGRKGSGLPGGRDAYADASLKPAGGDWEKYLYSYRLWGRLLYNPDTPPEAWRRFLRGEFGAGAPSVEAALAYAGRILPLVTTAHLPSAANNGFWPEIYTNMPIVDEKRPHPYGDTPSPKRFGAVSPLDPEMFARIDDFAEELLGGERSGRYSPLEVAAWLEDLADRAAQHLAEAESRVADRSSAVFRRLALDAAIQSGLGRFFARKLRAGALYALFERSGEEAALWEALKAYRAARSAWAELAATAQGVYVSDITFGRAAHLRGHWADRLSAIDQDIADMERRSGQTSAMSGNAPNVRQALREALARPRQPQADFAHTPPASFRPGAPLGITASAGRTVAAATLRYRHANQGETYRSGIMEAENGIFRAAIPGNYTGSPYPLVYFFVLRDGRGRAWIYPGFRADFSTPPYFAVRQAH
jgi:hypothetical protein